MGRHSGQNCWGSFVGVALNAALSGLSQRTVNVAMGVFINTGHSPQHTSVHCSSLSLPVNIYPVYLFSGALLSLDLNLERYFHKFSIPWFVSVCSSQRCQKCSSVEE